MPPVLPFSDDSDFFPIWRSRRGLLVVSFRVLGRRPHRGNERDAGRMAQGIRNSPLKFLDEAPISKDSPICPVPRPSTSRGGGVDYIPVDDPVSHPRRRYHIPEIISSDLHGGEGSRG